MATTVSKTCKRNSNSKRVHNRELENRIYGINQEVSNESEYNVKHSITIKSGCITNRYLHVVTNHYHQFTYHLTLNKCVSDFSLTVSMSFL